MNPIDRLKQATDYRVCFCSSSGVLGKLIKFFEHGQATHAALSFALPDLPCRLVLEAAENGVVIRPEVSGEWWEQYSPTATVNMLPGLIAAASLVGEGYDFGGLVGMAPVEIERHGELGAVVAAVAGAPAGAVAAEVSIVLPDRNYLQSPGREFCSELVCLAMQASKWPGSESLDRHATDPEQLRQVCKSNHG